MHAKAYSFFRSQQITSLLGSSNWTANAITSSTTELNVYTDAEGSIYGLELKRDSISFFIGLLRLLRPGLILTGPSTN